jgi:hypothetical protein
VTYPTNEGATMTRTIEITLTVMVDDTDADADRVADAVLDTLLAVDADGIMPLSVRGRELESVA